MSLFQLFSQMGLTNRDTEDLGCLQESSRDRRGTFCSSPSCIKGFTSARGKLVYVGDRFHGTCPKCGLDDYLYFECVSSLRALKFRNLEKYYKKKAERQKAGEPKKSAGVL